MSEPTLIGLVALKQHGKDTTADILVKKYGFKKAAYADRLKSICMREFDMSHEQVYGDLKEVPDTRWCDEKGEPRTPRFILQHVGTEGFRKVDHDFWIKAFFMRFTNEEKLVITDVRFQNEVDAVLERGGQIWVIDMPHKPATGNWKTNLVDRVLRRGAYHSSEDLARRIVTDSRRDKLNQKFHYISFMYGEPSSNEDFVISAWNLAKCQGLTLES